VDGNRVGAAEGNKVGGTVTVGDSVGAAVGLPSTILT
jgi:hypothetical protein